MAKTFPARVLSAASMVAILGFRPFPCSLDRDKVSGHPKKGGDSMRASSAVALAVCGFALAMHAAPTVAQHHASKPKVQKAKTDAELIASAMSVAPAAVSKDATIVVVGEDAKLRTLREGQGAFTCVPDDPSTPGTDPMCLDRHGMEWFKALLAHEKPPEGQIWFVYMLKGSSDASNDDPFASEPPTGKK
jgi:hypothetical protein